MLSILLAATTRHAIAACDTTRAPVWPARFTLVQRRIPDEGTPGTAVTYYDTLTRPKANLIVDTPDDGGDVLWDLELQNESYYYHPAKRTCQPQKFHVGILRRDWLANGTFLGRRIINGRPCLAWTKVDFIDYYADAETCAPVSWYFHSMRARFDTIYWAPGVAAPEGTFAPPAYCLGRPSVPAAATDWIAERAWRRTAVT